VVRQECYCPVEVALYPGVRHAPHREAPALLLASVSEFAGRLLREHHEGELSAAASAPLSEVRDTSRHPLTRTSEAKGH
jgi:hypothetical protein